MKVMQFIIYFFIFNAVLLVFTSITVFSISANMGMNQTAMDETSWGKGDIVAILGDMGFNPLTGLVVAIFAIGTSYLTGASAYVALAYAAMVGMFVTMWGSVFNIMDKMLAFAGEGSFGIAFGGIKFIIATIFIIMFVYGLIQMATGGGRSFD